MPVHQSLCPFTSWLSPRRRRLLALSRVPSDNLPFACQFPLRNDEFPQFASSALLLLLSAGVSRVILYRIYEFEPSIPVPALSCKLFYSITGNILLEIYTALLLIVLYPVLLHWLPGETAYIQRHAAPCTECWSCSPGQPSGPFQFFKQARNFAIHQFHHVIGIIFA